MTRAYHLQVFNDGQIVVVKENIKNVWTEFLYILRNFKENASNLTNPRLLGEQLQIIFRDESKLYDFDFKTDHILMENFTFFFHHFSCSK